MFKDIQCGSGLQLAKATFARIIEESYTVYDIYTNPERLNKNEYVMSLKQEKRLTFL